MMQGWQRKGGPWDDQAFTWIVFICPLLLLMDWPVLRGLGVVVLAAVLVRGWHTARRDPGMLAFLGFSLVVTGIDDYGGRALREITVPFTGWLATAPYSFAFFAVVALWSGSPPFRRAVVALLAVEVLFGLEEWIRRWPRFSENPYLHISVWRPLWTVATPLSWIAILLNGERNRHGESGMPAGPPNKQMQLTSGATQAMDARS